MEEDDLLCAPCMQQQAQQETAEACMICGEHVRPGTGWVGDHQSLCAVPCGVMVLQVRL